MGFVGGGLESVVLRGRRVGSSTCGRVRMSSATEEVDGVSMKEIRSHSSVRHHVEGVPDELLEYGMDTQLIKGGQHPEEWTTDPLGRSVVNPPVYHNSTVLFKSTDSLKYAASDWPFTGMWYGRHGNPTSWALEEAYAMLEGGFSACAVGSGVAANNASILAFVQSGDHILITDGCYDPTRAFATTFLKRFGVETSYFSPLATADEVQTMIQPNTKIVFVESPSSLSFELMDLPALAKVAHDAGAVVICDNTWGPVVLKPFELGCDVVINAATKYIGGHSDLMLGLLAAKDEEIYRKIKNSVKELGCPPGPDDCYLALRGLRTLSVRIRQHEKNALEVARWLEQRPEVARVMHPALESHPQHDLFKRDFSGSTGLFGFQLKEFSDEAVVRMVDNMKIFSIGFSWGGFESIIMKTNINAVRSVKLWEFGPGLGPTIRVSIGLEDTADLINDLEDGFERLRATS